MKRFIAILAALALTGAIMAQQGKIFVTGSLDFNSNSSSIKSTINNVSTTLDIPASPSFIIGLQGHYMITDNLAVGLGIGFYNAKNYSYTISNNDLFDYTSLLDVVPSVIYFIDISEKFKFAPEIAIGFGFGNITNEYWDAIESEIEDETNDISYLGLALMPLNFNYNINDNLSLSFGFGNISWSRSLETDNFSIPNTERNITNNDINISFNNNFRIGLRYFF